MQGGFSSLLLREGDEAHVHPLLREDGKAHVHPLLREGDEAHVHPLLREGDEAHIHSLLQEGDEAHVHLLLREGDGAHEHTPNSELAPIYQRLDKLALGQRDLSARTLGKLTLERHPNQSAMATGLSSSAPCSRLRTLCSRHTWSV